MTLTSPDHDSEVDQKYWADIALKDVHDKVARRWNVDPKLWIRKAAQAVKSSKEFKRRFEVTAEPLLALLPEGTTVKDDEKHFYIEDLLDELRTLEQVKADHGALLKYAREWDGALHIHVTNLSLEAVRPPSFKRALKNLSESEDAAHLVGATGSRQIEKLLNWLANTTDAIARGINHDNLPGIFTTPAKRKRLQVNKVELLNKQLRTNPEINEIQRQLKIITSRANFYQRYEELEPHRQEMKLALDLYASWQNEELVVGDAASVWSEVFCSPRGRLVASKLPVDIAEPSTAGAEIFDMNHPADPEHTLNIGE